MKKAICDECKIVYACRDNFRLEDVRCPVCGGHMIGHTAERGLRRENYDWKSIDTERLRLDGAEFF
jgi:PHP family Zn ribbon phosphoesterase